MIADGRISLNKAPRPLLPHADTTMVAHGCTLRYSSIDAVLSHVRAHEWLSNDELRVAEGLRNDHRRRAWLSGRLLHLKRLLAGQLSEAHDGARIHPRELEIVSRDAAGGAARPAALLGGRPLDWSLSIAHTDRHVLVAVASAGVAVGVDLVDAQFAPGEGFCRLWFTAAEQQRLREMSSPSAAALWAIKEAVYKATNHGDQFMPQQTEVDWQRGGRLICRAPNPAAAHCQSVTWPMSGGEIAALATLSESHIQWGACHDD